jgi:two-component sensor histidine kinase
MREITEAKQRQQQLVRRNRQLAALTNLAAVANSTLNFEQIARNTLQVGLESTGMDGGCIHLADSPRRQVNLYVAMGLPAELAEQVRAMGWGEGVIGTVVNSGQPAIYGDLNAEAPTLLSTAIKHGFRALVVVPVKTRGEVLGAVCLISRRERAFTTDVVELVTAIGNQLGIALTNAKLYDRLVRENEKLNSVVYISSDSAQRLELEPMLKRIMIRAASLLKADAGYIVRFDNQAHESEVVAATAPLESLIGPRGPASRGLSGLVRDARQGRIFTGEEVARSGYSPIYQQVAMRSALVVPLMARGEIIGTLTLVRKADSGSDFTREDLDLIEAFAGRAALAIDNAQLLKDLQNKNRLLELLMDEAHHRIKNNLQMVSGLLQLQAEVAETGSAVEHLRAANARIQSIAQVHDLLSQDMPEKVDAHKLLGLITATLVSTVAGGEDKPPVTLEVDQLWLSSEQAVALALIVNELVSNALLHARPPTGEKLLLRVTCRREGSTVRLTVHDNGGGFPQGRPDPATAGQGLRIIAQLAQVNLRGALEIGSRAGGVHAEVRFDLAAQTAPLPLRGAAWKIPRAG